MYVILANIDWNSIAMMLWWRTLKANDWNVYLTIVHSGAYMLWKIKLASVMTCEMVTSTTNTHCLSVTLKVSRCRLVSNFKADCYRTRYIWMQTSVNDFVWIPRVVVSTNKQNLVCLWKQERWYCVLFYLSTPLSVASLDRCSTLDVC